jgi:sterol-4alpha-carboxylate 3-dehydrogenase (decarboxylating)
MKPPARNLPSKITTTRTGKRYLVIGGHGFLGSHIVEALLARGEDKVAIFDLSASSLFAAEVAAGTVQFHQGNVLDLERLKAACRGVDTVFHTAASVDFWSDLPFEYAAIHAVNVVGTENAIAACAAEGVGQLLFTSSAIVVVPRDLLAQPLELADENAPYPTAPFLNHYVATKGLAERAVLAADGRGALRTAAVRPGGMYGPRDTVITSSVAAGLPGIGRKDNIIDHIYVENVVHAFLLMETRLVAGSPLCGQSYFVTNYADPPPGARAEDRAYFAFNDRFFAALGRRFRLAPKGLISALAWTSQTMVRASRGRAARVLGELRKLRPASLTLSRGTYYFTHKKAAADFGYQPLYSEAEAIEITRKHVLRA